MLGSLWDFWDPTSHFVGDLILINMLELIFLLEILEVAVAAVVMVDDVVVAKVVYVIS